MIFDEVKKRIGHCTNCNLFLKRRKIVYGRGTLPCDILFLGEGPGESEDVIGSAFVGRSGKLLDHIIEDAGCSSLSVFFSNIVLCHPCDRPRGQNRPPRPIEVLRCIPNIAEILDAAQARVIVLVGREAEEYYKKIVPKYLHIEHPASLLRHGGRAAPRYIHTVRSLHFYVGEFYVCDRLAV